jgi:hypothetical protein
VPARRDERRATHRRRVARRPSAATPVPDGRARRRSAAEAATSLREDQYRALATLAALPRPEVDRLLLTADRFVNDRDCPVTQVEREELLHRLGVFGVRLAISLIRLGAAPTATVLAHELTARSGIDDLRTCSPPCSPSVGRC